MTADSRYFPPQATAEFDGGAMQREARGGGPELKMVPMAATAMQ
jgi:hypothetical protein